ncbi:MAG: TIGR03067 domain-containing protein [Planctomycetes bacterium]|nr:TIGR03067 domain-containing protein [Planctomycetota bacterium]
MKTTLPPRPNLDHLRRQAKSLLAALATGDRQAIATIVKHLPAAKGMSETNVRAAGFRLADAQSAVARQTGFAGWPQLARHVEQLRALEGTWEFVSLEIDGSALPAAGLIASRLLMDGDRFRMESPEGTYEGVFNIDVESEPHGIDIEFVEGPEAGNWNYGIFRLVEDRLELCLDMNGKDRPREFRTGPGSGRAFEILRRASSARPEAVKGGTRKESSPPAKAACSGDAAANDAEFAYVESELLTRLQGEWAAEKLIRDGKELPGMMLKSAVRSAKGNDLKVSVGGQVMVHALVRLDERQKPVSIDYLLQAGPGKGHVQRGIMEWHGDVACFCMAAPGIARPTDFECPAGSGRTVSHWRRK